MADTIKIERVGGLGGFGLPGGKLRSFGQLDLANLPAHIQAAVEELFNKPASGQHMPDAFRYRLTRSTPSGEHTVEVPESDVPEAVANAVKDELL